MKANLIIFALALIAVGVLAVVAQFPLPLTPRTKVDTFATPTPDVPPSGQIQVCGGVVVKNGEQALEASEIASEGCDNIVFKDLGGGYWFGYGTRVVVYTKQ